MSSGDSNRLSKTEIHATTFFHDQADLRAFEKTGRPATRKGADTDFVQSPRREENIFI
jgi:hypothetical protein